MGAITKNKPFLALAAVVIIGLPLAYFFLLRGGSETHQAEAGTTATATVVIPERATLGVGPTYIVEERVVNLQASGAVTRYLRFEVVLEFQPHDPAFYTLKGEAHAKAQEAFLEEISPKAPVIEDTILDIVGGKSVEQLVSPQGKDRLKDELAEAITKRIGDPKVVNVYFTQFVTQ